MCSTSFNLSYNFSLLFIIARRKKHTWLKIRDKIFVKYFMLIKTRLRDLIIGVQICVFFFVKCFGSSSGRNCEENKLVELRGTRLKKS